jgi:hypothetical protein
MYVPHGHGQHLYHRVLSVACSGCPTVADAKGNVGVTPRIHFGPGSRERVDKVEILWPAGKTETLTDLAADHFYNVKEGEGIVPVERSRPVLPKY